MTRSLLISIALLLPAACEVANASEPHEAKTEFTVTHNYPYLDYGPTTCGQCNEKLACPRGGSVPGDCQCGTCGVTETCNCIAGGFTIYQNGEAHVYNGHAFPDVK